ncbi:hypothetical protein E2C01_021980 [Portunus trituberculatus]|uniref:Uncharacterized protein n=1 Tax=Portunus trituberculatus TaxID=210409 RepID=A0A5B7E476_PORTR|nr:hypothetical protein [Portunus trituberculatus]
MELLIIWFEAGDPEGLFCPPDDVTVGGRGGCGPTEVGGRSGDNAASDTLAHTGRDASGPAPLTLPNRKSCRF